ncbi:AI-2E family transporter [uncultured Dubosiella sp.]|uniref:AI-2E family transporter n=1 Tax=uncultured Dubosiella sp. TaxID=1937011 RepID=UPI00272F3B1B|nr:AI-2E family transporter [uncultured Dubosiella sp.]
MHIEISKEMRKRIIVYSSSLILAILAYTLINRFDEVMGIAGRITSILFPFLLGFAIAFILNQPVMTFEEKVLGRTKLNGPSKRILSELVIFIIAIGLLILIVGMVVPSLIDSIKTFTTNVQEYSNTLYEYMDYIAKTFNISSDMISKWFADLDLLPSITEALRSYLPKIADYSVGFVKELANFILAIAAAFYILLDKESLIRGIKKLNYSIFSKEIANYLTLFSHDAKEVFEQYIVGNLLDSLIVGVICYFGMLIFKIPYAPMIGFIVGVTNVIPIFGPFLGAIPVIIILLLINPWFSLIFAIFILVLQQIDGNVLKPVILGDKLGISGFWILFSVTVGGALGSILGMFLGVPVFALIYASLKDLAQINLERKNIEINDESGIIR